MSIDATRIAPRLYQGSFPRSPIAPLGFDVLVLCARELQHRTDERGLITLRCPLQDDGVELTRAQWVHAVRTAETLADMLARGKRVLITCAQGRNRSGLVTALTLYIATGQYGLGAEECIDHIRGKRRDALTSDLFVAALRSLPRKRRREIPQPLRRAMHRTGPAHQRVGVDVSPYGGGFSQVRIG